VNVCHILNSFHGALLIFANRIYLFVFVLFASTLFNIYLLTRENSRLYLLNCLLNNAGRRDVPCILKNINISFHFVNKNEPALNHVGRIKIKRQSSEIGWKNMAKILAKIYLRLVINGNQVKRSKMRGARNLPGAHKNPKRCAPTLTPPSPSPSLFSCPSSCSVNLFVGWLQRASGSLTTAKAN